MSDSIVIVGAARTPMGAFQGDFSTLAAHDLGGAAIKEAVLRAGIAPDLVTEVLMGRGRRPRARQHSKAVCPKVPER
jgi:acetyl-CoA C-acetyltransferase